MSYTDEFAPGDTVLSVMGGPVGLVVAVHGNQILVVWEDCAEPGEESPVTLLLVDRPRR